MPVFAQEPTSATAILGQASGEGAHFEITDSGYLNIALGSSEEIKLRMESVANMVTIVLEPPAFSIATSTTLMLSGFSPQTTYYLYEDSYENLTEFTTGEDGSYSYTQDISVPHIVFIQQQKSTKFIRNNATGGDCVSIGIWNLATLTCILTIDVLGTVQINNDGITLDGNGHEVMGNGTGNGVYLPGRAGVTIKNLSVTKFSSGIFLFSSSNNTLINNIISNNNNTGIYLNSSSNNILNNNTAQENNYSDIYVYASSDSHCNNIITNTTGSDSRPIKYLSGAVSLSNENLSQLILCNADGSSINNVIIAGSAVKNNNGLVLMRTDFATIANVDSSNNAYGIDLYISGNNTLANNTVINNYNGIFLFSSDNNIIRGNTASNNASVGIYPYSSGNNQIYNNNLIGNFIQTRVQGNNVNVFNLVDPTGGNYWSNYDTSQEGCNDANGDNFCDAPYVFTGGQDNLPWTMPDGWNIPTNQPPIISNLSQLKSDSATVIAESGITTESSPNDPTKGIIIFKGNVSDPDGDQIKLQVELKEFSQPFDGSILLESSFAPSGSDITITKDLISEGMYHWRARFVDDRGNVSDWQEFGTAGNVDFQVKLVPLYTQVRSPWPSDELTNSWDDKQYTSGNSNCGRSIAQCGCALTSGVMVLRYYNIKNTNNEDVDPKTLNDWLNSQPKGYSSGGSINWLEIARYANNLVKYDISKSGDYLNNYPILNEYLDKNQPAIAKEKSGRGGISREHFMVIDNKLTTTYGVKDPAWYNTRKLNEITDSANKIRGYENGFDGLRLFYPSNGLAVSAISLNLASPAEFLITDPLGRRYGKDPTTNIEYTEIPDASYFTEGIDDSTGELPPSDHENKTIYMENPLDGQYDIKVIGTGSGSYTIDSAIYDNQGQTHTQTFTSNTDTNIAVSYNLNYDSQQPENISIQPTDTKAPIISSTQLNSKYILNFAPIVFNFSAQDAGVGVFNVSAKFDGVPIESGTIINFNQLGSHTIEIVAEDYIGNKKTETIVFDVIYNFGGFLSPIKTDGMGIYKWGRTLPIKFELTDINNIYISTAINHLYLAKIDNDVIGVDEVALSTSNADTGNQFRYDQQNNQYIFNLNTNAMTTGTWQLKVILDDGQSYAVIISIR